MFEKLRLHMFDQDTSLCLLVEDLVFLRENGSSVEEVCNFIASTLYEEDTTLNHRTLFIEDCVTALQGYCKKDNPLHPCNFN